ncbi:unnamed protein product [Callosobruchus maculatus]|uniref:THAP-type domain-containing protein n=1 Tax=Callosobruchus maculatus TaxID=64391 RepID=A0A653DRP2_CALMS|nr:unnamed protein product [Callosobruchus maculatus]
MVRTCYVYKINSRSQESLDLSFHRLPADPVRRGVWLSLLGIDSANKLPKVALICSRHFDVKDFTYDFAGRRHLKDGADPLEQF